MKNIIIIAVFLLVLIGLLAFNAVDRYRADQQAQANYERQAAIGL